MAIVIPAPVGIGQETQGMLDFLLSMESLDVQKESLKLRKKSQALYGEQTKLARDRFELTKEYDRRSAVAKAIGDKAAASVATRKAAALKDMSDKEFTRIAFASEINKNLQSQTFALQEQVKLGQFQLRVSAEDRAKEQAMNTQRNKFILGLAQDTRYPAAIGRQAIADFLGGKKSLDTIQQDLDAGEKAERNRLMREAVEEETRTSETKKDEAREIAEIKTELDEGSYEASSLRDVKAARANYQKTPEVRWLRLKSIWKTEAAEWKLVTENASYGLGLHDEWLAASQEAEPKKGFKGRMKEGVKSITPDLFPKKQSSDPLGIRR